MWQTVGQTRAVSLLKCSLEKQALAHAYLFIGPGQVGKMTLALDYARALNCEADEVPCQECPSCRKIAAGKHADVQVIGLGAGENGEAKPLTEIGIAQIREMQHSASLPPFEGRYKVFVINGAERLSHEAANCLLKTLEEPAERVVFILLATSEKSLPATVVSRCQRLDLPPLGTAEMVAALEGNEAIEPDRAKLLAGLAGGCLGWALTAARDDSLLEQRAERLEGILSTIAGDGEERFSYARQLASQFTRNRELVGEVLELWLSWWRDVLLIKAGCPQFITNIDQETMLRNHAQDYGLGQIKDFIARIQLASELLRKNANAQLTLEVLMLNIPGKVRE